MAHYSQSAETKEKEHLLKAEKEREGGGKDRKRKGEERETDLEKIHYRQHKVRMMRRMRMMADFSSETMEARYY